MTAEDECEAQRPGPSAQYIPPTPHAMLVISFDLCSSPHTWRISQLKQDVGDLLPSCSVAPNQTLQISGGASSSPCSSSKLTDSPTSERASRAPPCTAKPTHLTDNPDHERLPVQYRASGKPINADDMPLNRGFGVTGFEGCEYLSPSQWLLCARPNSFVR
jgi:hypothetical protein